MRTGFYIVGRLLGFKSSEYTNRATGEVVNRNTMGLQMSEPDGYGGYNTSTQNVRVDDDVISPALKTKLESMKGKLVHILVFPREWAMENGRTGIVYKFTPDSVIEVIEEKA